MKKLQLSKRNIEYNFFDIFSAFGRCSSYETEADKKLLIIHLYVLQKQFLLYFKDVSVSKFE
jgi:hypothetical protein